MNYILLLVGKSGTGKSTVEKILAKDYGYKPLKSYTTRKPRYEGEDTHIFVTDVDYEAMKDEVCAFTEFDGHKYWSTKSQVDESDVYIIDPDGIDYFKKTYTGDSKIVVVELLAQRKLRRARMHKRGDSWWKIRRRLTHDKKAFGFVDSDVVINANSDNPNKVTKDVADSVRMFLGLEEFLNGKA